MDHNNLAASAPVAHPGQQPGADSLVWLALRRACVSQMHPRMIAALFLPLLIAIVGAILLWWLFWTPLNTWLQEQAADWGVFNTLDAWFVALGLFSLKLWMLPIMAAGFLLPMAGVLGLAIAAIFVMPIVLQHLEKRQYHGLRRQGSNTTVLGTWNAIWVSFLFVCGWVITLPLWLIPPFALILPPFWWAFALNRMLRVDAMIEHASAAERTLLWRRHGAQLWMLAGALALLNLIPMVWLFIPVFSALAYGHFCLEALRRLRAETTIELSE